MRTTGLAILLGLVAVVGLGATGSREQEFSLPGIRSITVAARGMDVSVVGDDTDTVSVRSELPGDSLFEHPDFALVHEVKGSRLSIRLEAQRLFAAGGPGKITLVVPRDATVAVETASGGVSLQGLERGVASARTVSGEIRARDVRGELDLNTTSGRISLDGAEGRVDARSVSGRIRGDRVRLTADSSFTSVSGDISVALDTPLDDLRFDLTTLSGIVRVGTLRTHRGLHMGFGEVSVTGSTVSGSIRFE